ncbi:thiamine pyrophosphate-dependent enzyme [Actinomycetospora endophytica]|uniref:Thiamine pyrophosphate-dependent enzyme n=1 Tax=Actinomycetospora endophytica TaxID=2291215 RepID=A0ABS8PFL4_9PSEU|nr:thiamine pyrophosphate-dependent enzyme [Actinomycetospora endophytica]MCD2197041.1 thiamine pyrophosphate-dependent enzyme [Actinomycetospora endophytica]
MTTVRPPVTTDELRRLMALMTGDEKHSAAATSTLDVLHVLYGRVLRVDAADPADPARDRFLLSKGHGPMAYYAVLAAHGFLDPTELVDWAGPGSRLGLHPDRTLIPGVEIGSGSLGHGLPLAVGTAIGLRARRITRPDGEPRVVVLVGDAELDEGSNHEAIAYAGRRGLANLTAVVVDNSSATHGWPGTWSETGLAERFLAEGWRAITVDGRDHDAIEIALDAAHDDRPLAVVARVERKDS